MRDNNGMTIVKSVYQESMARSIVFEMNGKNDGYLYSYKYVASAGVYNILKGEV